MQGMIAGKRSRGKPRQRWEKDITDTFGTMKAKTKMGERHHRYVWYDGSSKQSGDGQRHLGSDVLTRICSEKRVTSSIFLYM